MSQPRESNVRRQPLESDDASARTLGATVLGLPAMYLFSALRYQYELARSSGWVGTPFQPDWPGAWAHALNVVKSPLLSVGLIACAVLTVSLKGRKRLLPGVVFVMIYTLHIVGFRAGVLNLLPWNWYFSGPILIASLLALLLGSVGAEIGRKAYAHFT